MAWVGVWYIHNKSRDPPQYSLAEANTAVGETKKNEDHRLRRGRPTCMVKMAGDYLRLLEIPRHDNWTLSVVSINTTALERVFSVSSNSLFKWQLCTPGRVLANSQNDDSGFTLTMDNSTDSDCIHKHVLTVSLIIRWPAHGSLQVIYRYMYMTSQYCQ